MAERFTPTNWGLLAGFMGLSVIVGLLAGLDPKFAIAASIAVGFVLIVFADLTAGLAVFGFFSFLELLGQSSVVSVGKLGGLLLALGWIAFVATRQDAKSDFLAVHAGVSMLMGIFLAWVGLSTIWAENASLVPGSFVRYLLNVVLFMIVFTAVRTKRQAMMVMAGFLGGCGAAALYGTFFASATQSIYAGRVTGAGLDPNELASVLVAGIALAAGLAINLKRQPGLRLLAMSGGVLCFMTALFTGSRGGLVALGFMLIAAIFFGGRWRGRVLAAGAVIATFAALYILTLAPPDIRDHVTGSQSQGEKKVPEYRTTLWQVGMRMYRANPITGVGADNFKTSSRHYLLQPGTVYHSEVIIEEPNVAHNTYLQTAAELGTVGIGLFLAIIVFSLSSCLRAARNFSARGDIGGEALARSIGIALVGVLAADFFISQMYNKQLWLLLGIGPAILAISTRADPDRE
jgi:putative inorganic carbon (HCO3(-)) transporter